MTVLWIVLAAAAAGFVAYLVGSKLAAARGNAMLAELRAELEGRSAELARERDEHAQELTRKAEEMAQVRAALEEKVARVSGLETAVAEDRRWAEGQFRAVLDDFRNLWLANSLPLLFHELPADGIGEPARTQLGGYANRLHAWIERFGFGGSDLVYQLGLWAALKGELKEASDLFQDAALKGYGVTAWLSLGDCLWQLDRTERARVAYKNCLDFEATPPHVFRRFAKAAIDRRDFRDGISALERILERADNPVEVYAMASVAYTRLKQDEKAVHVAERGLKKHPRTAELMAKMIVPLHRLGKKDKAEKVYKEALELDPKCAEAAFSLGLAQLNAGDFKGATQLLRDAVELNKKYAEAYYGLGVVHNRQQQWKRALQYLNKAVELKPDYAEAYYDMKDAYEGLKDFDQAVAVLRKATALNPDFR
jgi:tetratricopeptide (TPR) repeat protein